MEILAVDVLKETIKIQNKEIIILRKALEKASNVATGMWNSNDYIKMVTDNKE